MPRTTAIPQAVSARYHACYNNTTYCAFSAALAITLGLDERATRAETHDKRHTQIMNLLTNASMELVGAEFYAGAGQRLGQALGAFDDQAPTLVKYATDHLTHFATGEHPWKAGEKIAHMATLALAGAARRALVRTLDHAALLPGWRGTTPYYWLLACTQIIQAAEIILRKDPSASYMVEKFGKGIDMLARGAADMVRDGNSPPVIRRFYEQITVAQDGRDSNDA